MHDALNEVTAISRNFYGVVRIREYGRDDPQTLERVLVHGRVMHGQQFMAPERRHRPTSYYAERSGVGRLLLALADRPIDVGAVGLGAGTIATYGKPGDRYRFYEIDPHIVDAAYTHFSFLGDSAARVDVAVGDGRLLLQDEATRRFDVLVVDAFSGDSIPVHLLTREAVELYRQRLKPGGVIALHVSNNHLDLRPVVGRHRCRTGPAVGLCSRRRRRGRPRHLGVGLDPAGRRPPNARPAESATPRQRCRSAPECAPGPTTTATSCRCCPSAAAAVERAARPKAWKSANGALLSFL